MLHVTICCILNGVRLLQQLSRVPSSASVYRKAFMWYIQSYIPFFAAFLAPSSCFAKVFLLSQIFICKILFFSHNSLSSFNFCIALVQHNIFFTFICMNDFRQQANLYMSSPLIWLFLFVCIFTIPLLVQYSCMLQQLSNSSFGTVEGYQQQIYNSSYGSAAGEQFAFIFPRYFLLKLFSSYVIFATDFLFMSFQQ